MMLRVFLFLFWWFFCTSKLKFVGEENWKKVCFHEPQTHCGSALVQHSVVYKTDIFQFFLFYEWPKISFTELSNDYSPITSIYTHMKAEVLLFSIFFCPWLIPGSPVVQCRLSRLQICFFFSFLQGCHILFFFCGANRMLKKVFNTSHRWKNVK